jgi:Zn-dependent peptidase ImmA (M78 family)
MIFFHRWMPACSTISAAVFAAALLLPMSEVLARGGGYGAYQRFMKQQMQVAQKQMQAMQKQQKEEYDAFMKRFDTNKNGKIDGKEKGPAQKYLRELQMGIDPDKAIKTMGRSTSTRSKRSSTK